MDYPALAGRLYSRFCEFRLSIPVILASSKSNREVYDFLKVRYNKFKRLIIETCTRARREASSLEDFDPDEEFEESVPRNLRLS